MTNDRVTHFEYVLVRNFFFLEIHWNGNTTIWVLLTFLFSFCNIHVEKLLKVWFMKENNP